MKKFLCILKETIYMIKQYKIYFLAPILFMLLVLTLLCCHLGVKAIIAFIYAGV